MKLIGLPGNEVPQGLEAHALTTPDGVTLRYALAAGAPAPRGTVCVFTGRTEYIEKYFETIGELRARGFAVAIVEWRGQGLSQRRLRNRLKGHVRSFARYRVDLETFMSDVVLPDCPPPYYALANSAGAAVILKTLCERTWFSRAVLVSPMIALADRRVPRPLIRLLARAAVTLGLGRAYVPGARRRLLLASDFPGNIFTSDVGRFTRETRTLQAAPQLGIAGPTFAWLNAALQAMDAIARMPHTGAPRAPVLIITAGADSIVSSDAAHQFALRNPNAASVVAERSRHEILQERDEVRAQFWAAFDSFLVDRQGDGSLPQPVNKATASA